MIHGERVSGLLGEGLDLERAARVPRRDRVGAGGEQIPGLPPAEVPSRLGLQEVVHARRPAAQLPLRRLAQVELRDAAQELSRLVRRKLDDGRWRLYFATRGRVPQPRLGWGNFEFLRTGKVLNALADDLRAEVWDRRAIRDRIAAATPLESRGSVHRLSFQLMRIYTVDQMLRSAPARPSTLAAPAGFTRAVR